MCSVQMGEHGTCPFVKITVKLILRIRENKSKRICLKITCVAIGLWHVCTVKRKKKITYFKC